MNHVSQTQHGIFVNIGLNIIGSEWTGRDHIRPYPGMYQVHCWKIVLI